MSGALHTAAGIASLSTDAARFAATPEGARQAGEFVARAVTDARLPWAADRAALAVYLQALWLIRHGHQDGPILVLASYTPADRSLVVNVGDVDRMLPDVGASDPGLAGHEPLLAALVEHVGLFEAVVTESGRVLAARFRVRGPFVVRTGWVMPPYDVARHHYQDFDGSVEARAGAQAAVAAIGTVREGYTLTGVHLQGPEDEDSAWARVERHGSPAPAGALELSFEEVAELTRAALRACSFDWASRQEAPPCDLVGLFRAAQPSLRLSASGLRQFAQSVIAAKTPAGPVIRDPLLALVAVAHSDPDLPIFGLQRQLSAAWGAHENEIAGELARRRTLADLDEIAADPLRNLALSGCYHLVARDPRTGRLRVAREISALGIAGAVIAECLLAGLLTIQPDGCLSVTATDTAAVRVSLVARELVATVEAEKPLPIETWLAYVATKGPDDVEQALLEAEVLVRAERSGRRLFGRAEGDAVPADAGLVDRIVIRATFPSRVPEASRAVAAVLHALVRATGQHEADKTTWWMAEEADVVAALLDQSGPDVARLIESVTAAVTTTVAAGRR
ncbi:GPP34 family phosphoprotein [Actinospica robiniae]|uniref:GPP34 family phosphoprotein n=1 Tax=Actinospica robiniae TaxID=304901 RepID=UPI000423D45D|nr:GPP34 family phosphoprotein [Actinospica robiniae]